MAARSKAWFCCRSFAGIAGSNSIGGMDVCLLWVLLGRGLCVGLITRPEESYSVCVCVCVCACVCVFVCVWWWYWSRSNEETVNQNRAEAPQEKNSHYNVRYMTVSTFRRNILPQSSEWIKLFQDSDYVVKRRKRVAYNLYIISSGDSQVVSWG